MNFDPKKPFLAVLANGNVHSVPAGSRLFTDPITDSRSLTFYDASRKLTLVVPVKGISFISQPRND